MNPQDQSPISESWSTFPQAVVPNEEIMQLGQEALYTISQAAEALRTTRGNVKRLIELRILDAIKLKDMILVTEDSISRQCQNRSSQWLR